MESHKWTEKIGRGRMEGLVDEMKKISEDANREIRQKMRYLEFLKAHEGEELTSFPIWMEGYLCTGMEGIPQKACYLDRWFGKDFYDACCTYNLVMTEPDTKYPCVELHPKTRTAYIWGCRLFDNEEDARESFG